MCVLRVRSDAASGVDSVHSRVCVMLNAVYTIYIYIYICYTKEYAPR